MDKVESHGIADVLEPLRSSSLLLNQNAIRGWSSRPTTAKHEAQEQNDNTMKGKQKHWVGHRLWE
jgi:hypothetical protein